MSGAGRTAPVIRGELRSMGKSWRFEGFGYSTERGLERGETRIPLQPKARGLIELLLRAGGAAVSKETIAAALWPGDAASDESIARVVYHLRKALNAAGADVVRTLYGEGVQLSCPVEEHAGKDPPPDDAAALQMMRTVGEIAANRSSVAMAQAKQTLRFVILRYPKFAPAWAQMADCVAVEAWRGFIAPEAAASWIGEACATALSLDPRNAAAIAVSGWALAILSDKRDEGQRRLKHALDLAPNAWLIRYYRSWVCALNKDLDAALDEVQAAFVAHPLERGTIIMQAWLRLCRGEPDIADALASEALNLRPDVASLLVLRSIASGVVGDRRRAVIHAERGARIMDRDPFALSQLCYAYAEAGAVAEARRTFDLLAPRPDGYVPGFLAAPLLAMGDRACAERVIERAAAQKCPWRAFMWCDPRLKPVQSER